MRLRNCPECYGRGFCGRAGRCGFCHGKRKVNAAFVAWDTARAKEQLRVEEFWKKQYMKMADQCTKQNMKNWEEKHPKPRKFAK